jgi:hypothetical protein
MAECTGNHQAAADPGIASADDICSSAVALTTHPAQAFDLGTTALPYIATDEQGLISSCSTNVTVDDTTPPSILSLEAAPNILWPPNHKMVPVTIQVESVDICDSRPPLCSIAAIVGDEPIDGRQPDWEITGPLVANLRQEREGSGDGRVYTISVRCEDEAGLSTEATTQVVAPHDLNDVQ